MKILTTLAAVAATMALATPAMANDFSGIRVGVTAGVDDLSAFDVTDVTYGAEVGVDFPLGDKAIVGVEANVDNVFDRRNIGASARVGYAVIPNLLVYAKAGYANYSDVFSRKLDGVRVGGGLETNISGNSYVKAEYRYTNFEQGIDSHAGLIGLGLRF